MTEPDVALTDFALCGVNAVFMGLILRTSTKQHDLRFVIAGFFASISLAGLTGGLVHGFFNGETTVGYRILWPLTLILIGGTASAIWMINAYLLLSASTIQRIVVFIGGMLVVYIGVVLFARQSFGLAIAYYVPPSLTLLVILLLRYTQRREGYVLMSAGGLGLTFMAATIQQMKWGLHSRYFNHNATYHLIQAIGLWLLFLGLRELMKKEVLRA